MRLHKTDSTIGWLPAGSIMCPDINALKDAQATLTHLTEHVRWAVADHPRMVGQYSLGTATAELTRESKRDREGNYTGAEYCLELTFTKLGDGQELYTLVRSGRILPVVAYDAPQSGTPIRQFRDLLREFLVLCRVTLRRWEVTS